MFGDYSTLLSSFTGSDENPLSEGGNWAKVNSDSFSDMRRVDNQASSTGAAASDTHTYWTPDTLGPDVETYITLDTVPNSVDLSVRIQDPGGSNTWDGYWLQVEHDDYPFQEPRWGMFVAQNHAAVELGHTRWDFADGDKVGMRAICNRITGWLFQDGAWRLIIEVYDTAETFMGAGYVSFGCDDNNGRLDDFFAGTIPIENPCGPGQIIRHRRT